MWGGGNSQARGHLLDARFGSGGKIVEGWFRWRRGMHWRGCAARPGAAGSGFLAHRRGRSQMGRQPVELDDNRVILVAGGASFGEPAHFVEHGREAMAAPWPGATTAPFPPTVSIRPSISLAT